MATDQTSDTAGDVRIQRTRATPMQGVASTTSLVTVSKHSILTTSCHVLSLSIDMREHGTRQTGVDEVLPSIPSACYLLPTINEVSYEI